MKKSLIIISFLLLAFNVDAQANKNHNNLKQQKNMKNMNNTTILHTANAFVLKGDYESFLTYCTSDTKWVFVGERILHGKEEVRAYMKEFYIEPPVFDVELTIEDGDFVTVSGNIRLKNKTGNYEHFNYCDIWRFEDGKIAELKAFVIERKP
ncbi:nuclear transport factor 2 family protein [Flavobacterium sp. B17]|uniref:nuclear transport factor 2 family protein n=1 Tax=Flavobacterium sp. B17 TaxID=95618 RepID=UPI00034888CB|nr:nuclear transport factor 2 family protein [Flavobacterium sp. B17]